MSNGSFIYPVWESLVWIVNTGVILFKEHKGTIMV